MAKLSTRPNYDAATAAEFIARAAQSHTVRWKVDAYRGVAGGGITKLASDLPVVGGRLSIDASDPIRRKATIEIGGGNEWQVTNEGSPLAPFGQFLMVYCTIDKPDGSGWFPWIQMGELPIRTYTFETPSLITTVECTDWSGPVNDYLFTRETSFVHKTLSNAVVGIVNDALPYKSLDKSVTDYATTTKMNFVAQSARSRWEVAQEMCDIKGQECLFDATGKLIIRKDRLDSDDDGVMAGVGPDVGNKSGPVATIRDEEGGTLIAMTATVTREGGVNGVFYALIKPKKKLTKAERRDADTEGMHYTARALQASGASKWGDAFGFLPSVTPKTVKKLTPAIKNDWDHRAAAQLRRRRGVLRQVDLDLVGGYWIEADDLITLRFGGTWNGSSYSGGREEDHYCAAIEFDLSGKSPARLRCRQLNVVEVG